MLQFVKLGLLELSCSNNCAYLMYSQVVIDCCFNNYRTVLLLAADVTVVSGVGFTLNGQQQ